MGDRRSELDGPKLRMLLRHAARGITEPGGPPPWHQHPTRRGTAAVAAITGLCALLVGAGGGFSVARSVAPASVARPAAAAATPTVGTASPEGNPELSSLPKIVQAALQVLLQERNPQIIQRVDSVEVKYVTDAELQQAIASAWKTGRELDCGSGSTQDALAGHWYVIVLHGKFVTRSVPGQPDQYGSVAVIMVMDADLIAHLPPVPSPRPGMPTPQVVGQATSSFSFPPVGSNGEPLCWSLLPSS